MEWGHYSQPPSSVQRTDSATPPHTTLLAVWLQAPPYRTYSIFTGYVVSSDSPFHTWKLPIAE